MAFNKTSEERLAELEKEVSIKAVELEYRLAKQDDTLSEIKNVLVKQTDLFDKHAKIVIDIVKLQGKLTDIESKQENMQFDIDSRKKETTPLINQATEFLGKFRGMMLTAAFFFAIIQGMVGYFIGQNSNELLALRNTQSVHAREITEVKTELRIFKEPHQDPSAASSDTR